MPYPPNTYEPFGAPDGAYRDASGLPITHGQYALEWVRALGGDVVLSNNFTTMTVTMPFLPDGSTTPLPSELQSMLTDYRQSIIGAVRGVQYPPIVTLPAQCVFIDPYTL
jgi:hypothetical protein